jgi:methyltransferase family protein
VASAGIPLRGPHEPGVRAGRWHSARGPMGLSGWVHYPAAWWRARKRVPPERPWIVPAAIGWLRRRIRSDWLILELGAGRSTIWFAHRAATVLSFEDNEYWIDQTRIRLREERLDNVDLRVSPVEKFPAAVGRLPDRSFDLVVIDFLESPELTRVELTEPAMKKVRRGGLLLLDDSDRPGYADAYRTLAGWDERRFTGIKDGWPEVCETAIFRRPK